MKKQRSVIAHFHTYKNSGTSFDELLTENFGDSHLLFDGPFPYSFINQEELKEIVRRHPSHIAFSSHSIRLPVPTNLWSNVLAAVFIRHPILRVRSVYGFETRNSDDSDIIDFDAWITAQRKAKTIHALSNSQTQMFSGVYGRVGLHKDFTHRKMGDWRGSDLSQAKRNLQCVPLLARTEYFDDDVQRFGSVLAKHEIEFKFTKKRAANVSNPNAEKSTEDRLQLVRGELSEENYRWLKHANELDQELYEFAGKLLD